jgi:hypothetical protein
LTSAALGGIQEVSLAPLSIVPVYLRKQSHGIVMDISFCSADMSIKIFSGSKVIFSVECEWRKSEASRTASHDEFNESGPQKLNGKVAFRSLTIH